MDPQAGFDQEAIAAEFEKLHEFLVRTPELAEARERARARMAPTPREPVYSEHSVTLYRYHRDTPAARRTPMLVVPSLVNKPSVMDLLEGQSFVAAMLERGFEVFMLEWGEPNRGQREVPMEDYLRGYLDRAVRRTLRRTGAESLVLAGYCLGGTFSLLYTALDDPGRVGGLVTMVSPVNFHDHGLLSWWADPGHFDVDRVVDSFGNVPAEFFSASFPWLVPTASLKKARALYEKHRDEAFLEDFMALDIWLTENVAFPGRVYREFLTKAYQRNVLMEEGEWVFDETGTTARLADVTCPVLNLAARYDHVAPGESCLALEERVGTADLTNEAHTTGHLGFALGKDISGAPTTAYWDRIAAWAGARLP